MADKLTIREVEHVVALAKLALNNSEKKEFLKQLSKVLDYFQELKEVDTRNVSPTSQTTGLTNIFRDDSKIAQSMKTQEALAGSDLIHNDLFVVPSVITKPEKTV